MENLFTYGTLMCEDIMEAVSGLRFSSCPGVLEGYRRRAISGEPYPAVIAHPGESTEGRVYLEVPNEAWARLDRYEGEMYRRENLEIVTFSGERLSAWTYIIRTEYQRNLAGSDWDYAHFVRNGKADYMKALIGGM